MRFWTSRGDASSTLRCARRSSAGPPAGARQRARSWPVAVRVALPLLGPLGTDGPDGPKGPGGGLGGPAPAAAAGAASSRVAPAAASICSTALGRHVAWTLPSERLVVVTPSPTRSRPAVTPRRHGPVMASSAAPPSRSVVFPSESWLTLTCSVQAGAAAALANASSLD